MYRTPVYSVDNFTHHSAVNPALHLAMVWRHVAIVWISVLVRNLSDRRRLAVFDHNHDDASRTLRRVAIDKAPRGIDAYTASEAFRVTIRSSRADVTTRVKLVISC